MLLLIIAVKVDAQTATPTPGFSTGVPAGDTPAPASGGAGTIQSLAFSFLVSESPFHNEGAGSSWESGLGFTLTQDTDNIVALYRFDGLTQVSTWAQTSGAGTYKVHVITADSPVGDFESVDLPFVECLSDQCFLTAVIPAVDMIGIVIELTSDDAMLITKVRFDYGAVDNGSYTTDDLNCPVLTEEQKAKLDAVYYSQCTRCFVEPSPVRANILPTTTIASFPSSTFDFRIPLLVSGTPQTLTPGAIPIFPIDPTFTPAPSPTPGGNQYDFDFTANDGGWTVSASGFNTALGHYTGSGWQSNYAIGTEFVDGYQGVGIRLHFPTPAAVYGVYAEYTWLAGSSDRPGDHPNIVFVVGSTAVLNEVPPGASPAAWVGSIGGVSDILVQGVSGFNDSGSDPGGSFLITRVILTLDTLVLPTATPTGTVAPTVTGAPWVVAVNTPVPNDCSVAVFRDDKPVAAFDPTFIVQDYQCYTVIPEIHITLPGGSGLDSDETQICVTYFQMPLVQVLGITVSLDWILMGVIAWIIYQLLRL